MTDRPDPACTNCGQPCSAHAKVDYACPAPHNQGDDDMTFSTMMPFDALADVRLGKSLFDMRPGDWNPAP